MSESLQLVVFMLDTQRYALDLQQIERVIRAQAITVLPGAPSGVLGVIDVRGRVLPVFDIRGRFGLPAQQLRLSDQIVLARTKQRLVGLCVDGVEDVLVCWSAQILAAEQILPDSPYIQGVMKLPDGLLFIHDLDTFLTPDEWQALDLTLDRES